MLKQKEKNLFIRWRLERGYEYFISDGIFDEEEYLKQGYKILFVLKEANWENDDADLCELVLSKKNSHYWTTWNNIARWTKALIDPGEYPIYASNPDKSYWLRKVVAMTLKKVGGDPVAEDEIIREYATNDKRYLKEQIELYCPDIIVCCGSCNADILHDIVFESDQVSKWQEPITESNYNYFVANVCDKQVPVLSFHHQKVKGNHEKFKRLYDEMIEIGKILQSKYKNT